MSDPIDIVFSFDTTGSMYPCLSEVRRKVAATAARLFGEIPNLRIGIIAHGDYCDSRIYVTKHLDLTADSAAVINFINAVERTGGGDAPECYELVLQEARTRQHWRPAAKRVLVVIGDEVPHPVAHNPGRIDWRAEAKELSTAGILVHGVQCLNNRHAESFYSSIAEVTGGFHLRLSQFMESTELFMAIAYQQQGAEALQKYEDEVVKSGKMTRSLSDIFDTLSRRDPKTGRFRKVERDARAVDPARFQQVFVTEDMPIKALVESIGAEFKVGRGFYEFTKKEKIQDYKEIIIVDNVSGDMFSGGAAREILGLTTETKTSKVAPTFDGAKYSVFVQSTSANRKLIGGTRFLYEATA